MAYVLYAGAARHTGRRAALAGAVVAGESLIFAANGFRCPLTQLAEKIGAADGSVTDIWLPRWFAHNLPAVHVPLLAAAAYLNGRNLRDRQLGCGDGAIAPALSVIVSGAIVMTVHRAYRAERGAEPGCLAQPAHYGLYQLVVGFYGVRFIGDGRARG